MGISPKSARACSDGRAARRVLEQCRLGLERVHHRAWPCKVGSLRRHGRPDRLHSRASHAHVGRRSRSLNHSRRRRRHSLGSRSRRRNGRSLPHMEPIVELEHVDAGFTLKDICMIALQLLDRFEYIHSKFIIHRDLKPGNICVDYESYTYLYIIDFGLSKKYRSSRTGKHIKFSIPKKLTGTARYASVNALKGLEQSRRDDLESIGYVLIYFAKDGE